MPSMAVCSADETVVYKNFVADALSKIKIVDPFAKRLLAGYLRNREADIQALRSALASGDFQCISTMGHNMYGSGGAYGLMRISEIGADLQSAAERHEVTQISKLIDSLEAFVRTVHVV